MGSAPRSTSVYQRTLQSRVIRHGASVVGWIIIAAAIAACVWTLSGFSFPRILWWNFRGTQYTVLTNGTCFNFLFIRPFPEYPYPTWRYGAPSVRRLNPDGWVTLEVQRQAPSLPKGPLASPWQSSPQVNNTPAPTNPDKELLIVRIERPWYRYVDATNPSNPLIGYRIVPTWVVLLPLLAVASTLAWIDIQRWYRNKSRRRAGLCPNCSYDLRAHKAGNNCPECGNLITAPLETRARRFDHE